uniref:TIL domain containing protein n=1 Tax=Rhipicephalus zambeziensis TaxID=60191 RepID=A0A224YPJ8_9ACAR
MDITNPYSVTFGKTLSDVSPFVVSLVLRSGAAESTSGSLISESPLRSSSPHESTHSLHIDIGENLTNTARLTESASTRV